MRGGVGVAEVGLRLSTGNPSDPTTANQSFTHFDVKKAFNLDRFYVTPKATTVFLDTVFRF